MTFHSILFLRREDRPAAEPVEAPEYFADLNLDQIVDSITAGKQEYHLKPFFYAPLKDVDTIAYRHEVMRDLENGAVLASIESFAQRMSTMRLQLAQADKLPVTYQKERWFLGAVDAYCDAVHNLAQDLSRVEVRSPGFLALREYITNYARSAHFISLVAETKDLQADLSAVKYCLLLKGDSIKVCKYESETDYSADVEATFAKFQQGWVGDYRVQFPTWPEMNHVEAKVLELVAQLCPDPFAALDRYCAQNRDYLDDTLRIFDREIQFYVAYLEFMTLFKRPGLKFCYPHVDAQSKEVYAYDTFDLALADTLTRQGSPIVCNDFYLRGSERILVVSGPNQGGKTTFARTFGQLHHLASIGCPVPGREARLFLFDRLFTHFEKEETIENLRGKLQDDLVRIHAILGQATSSSIIILNEIFTSTTLQDAVFLGRKIMEQILRLDLLCVCVTFVDELASLSEKTVSLVSTVVPENPAVRTYRIVRRPAGGWSYALSIAEQHRLTYDCLKERLAS